MSGSAVTSARHPVGFQSAGDFARALRALEADYGKLIATGIDGKGQLVLARETFWGRTVQWFKWGANREIRQWLAEKLLVPSRTGPAGNNGLAGRVAAAGPSPLNWLEVRLQLKTEKKQQETDTLSGTEIREAAEVVADPLHFSLKRLPLEARRLDWHLRSVDDSWEHHAGPPPLTLRHAGVRATMIHEAALYGDPDAHAIAREIERLGHDLDNGYTKANAAPLQQYVEAIDSILGQIDAVTRVGSKVTDITASGSPIKLAGQQRTPEACEKLGEAFGPAKTLLQACKGQLIERQITQHLVPVARAQIGASAAQAIGDPTRHLDDVGSAENAPAAYRDFLDEAKVFFEDAPLPLVKVPVHRRTRDGIQDNAISTRDSDPALLDEVRKNYQAALAPLITKVAQVLQTVAPSVLDEAGLRDLVDAAHRCPQARNNLPAQAAMDLRLIVADQPYYAKRGDEGLNLNCEAQMSGSVGKVECRHLATYWEQRFREHKGKVNYDMLSTKAAIQANVTSKTEADYETARRTRKVSIIPNSEWGPEIARNFREMARKGDTERTILLLTTSHVMALGLRRKTDEAGRPTYVVKFYNPSQTVTHKRAADQDWSGAEGSLPVIEALTAGNFLSEDKLQYYDLNTDGGSVAFLGEPVGDDARHCTRLEGSWTADKVFHMFDLNLVPELEGLLRLAIKDLPSDKLFSLLAAKSPDGVPGLQMALQNGDADTIRAFGRIVTDLRREGRLRQEQVAELLAAKRKDDLPGLYLAFQNGHAEAIEAYGEILKASGLTRTQIAELLAAKRLSGVPGLHAALRRADADTIRAFGEILTDLLREGRLDQTQVTELLAAKSAEGTLGLQEAIDRHRTEAIAAYKQVLVDCLSLARQDGHAGAVQIYETILKEPGLGALAS